MRSSGPLHSLLGFHLELKESLIFDVSMKLTVGFPLSDPGCVSGLSSPVPPGIQGPGMAKGAVMFQADDTRS